MKYLSVLLLVTCGASAHEIHSNLECGAEVAAHIQSSPGHEPIARCVATCGDYLSPRTGEVLYEGETEYCPSFNGTWGINVAEDRSCQCDWGETHCGDGKACTTTYNGWSCELVEGKIEVAYSTYTLEAGLVSSELNFCGGLTPAVVVPSTPATPGVTPTPTPVESTSWRIRSNDTDTASCSWPREAGNSAVTITLEGEGFNWYVWPRDPWYFASLDLNGSGDRGPNHYGLNYSEVEGDLIAIGTNGMVLAGGLLGRMICIVPDYNHEGPWRLVVEG